MGRYLVDAYDLGHNPKGISRVLSSLIPRLVQQGDGDIVVACSPEARELLRSSGLEMVVEQRRPQSRWEQVDLPRLARSVGADAVYSHRECAPLWGPPFVLHVPEDPGVRWLRDPPATVREHARRAYSRVFFGPSLRHARVVAASTPAVATQLAARHRLNRDAIVEIPLGVDLDLFQPAGNPSRANLFHLGSSDPRDRTLLVLDAWLVAQGQLSVLPPLAIGGELGELTEPVRRRAADLGIPLVLHGRLDDDELASAFREAAVVIQPSSDEGFGLQPLEAMASGAPLVVTWTGAVAEVVGDGAVICSADPEDLAGGIIDALGRDLSLRHAARLRAQSYSWDATTDAVLGALHAAAG